MNTQASIQVNDNPVSVLKRAYAALLSMKAKEKLTDNNCINETYLFASVKGSFKTTDIAILLKYCCLITVLKLADNLCQLTILVDLFSGAAGNSGSNILLISEFFKRFADAEIKHEALTS